MHGWVLKWPTQYVRKEVHGERRLVQVIGGTAEFRTHAEARAYARYLRKGWPKLRYVLERMSVGGAQRPRRKARAAAAGAETVRVVAAGCV